MRSHRPTPTAPSISVDAAALAAFRQRVWAHDAEHRRDLPWRRTRDPYRIVVSEFMLQQTQVSRVLPKYEEFLRHFPDIGTLATASLADVLTIWQGLGYNRRAVALKRLAEVVLETHGAAVPRAYDDLVSLPGVGPATAAAVAAFAYDDAHPFIETNIRAVFIHHFFPDREGVRDAEILPLVEATLDRASPRDWYYALMDYGVWLKRLHPDPSRRSRHHVRQSPFSGSKRELRARVLRSVLTRPGGTAEQVARDVAREVPDEPAAQPTGPAPAQRVPQGIDAATVAAADPAAIARITMVLDELTLEGFLARDGDTYRIA